MPREVSSSYPSVQERSGSGSSGGGAPAGSTSLLEAFLKADPDGAMGGDKDDECAAALTAVANTWKQAHRTLWPAFAEAQGMTYGDQFGTFSWDARNFWQTRPPASEKKVTRNQAPHMQPILGDVASLQCQDELNLKCAPPNDTASAAASCEAGDQIVAWIWDNHDFDSMNVELREGAAVFGSSFLHPQWDASAGAEVEQVVGYEPVPGPPDPMTGAPGSMGLKPITQKIREGDFAHEMISVFEALPDPAAKREWDGEGFIIEQKIPIALLRQRYPDFKESFTRDTSPGGSDGSFYVDRMKGIQQRGNSGSGPASAQHSERTSVLTIYMKSCPEFYRGRWAVVAHGKLIYKGDNPVYPTAQEEEKGEGFPTYHWPVFRFSHRTLAGSYWGQGIAQLLIDPQRKLNGVISKKLHMLKRTSHPVLVKPKRADFTKTDEPDQQINVPAEMQPGSIYYLQSPVFPPELQVAERDAVDEMEKLAGIHAGTRGDSQSGNSGTKDRQLFQRDLGRLEIPKRRNDKQIAKVISFDLRMWRRYAVVKRTMRITGSNLATAVKQFDGASIAPGTDVVVYADLMMPKDPAGRMLHVKQAIETKVVDPMDPVTRAGLARLLGFPGWARQFESAQFADQRKADNENLRMFSGEAPTVEFWDDHLQHLARHYVEMKSETWINSTTPREGDAPDVIAKKQAMRQVFEQHVQMHQEALAKLQETEKQQAMPKEIMNYKDLPPDGQQQMAAQAGITIKDEGGKGGPGPGASGPPAQNAPTSGAPAPSGQPPAPAGPPPQRAAA